MVFKFNNKEDVLSSIDTFNYSAGSCSHSFYSKVLVQEAYNKYIKAEEDKLEKYKGLIFAVSLVLTFIPFYSVIQLSNAGIGLGYLLVTFLALEALAVLALKVTLSLLGNHTDTYRALMKCYNSEIKPLLSSKARGKLTAEDFADSVANTLNNLSSQLGYRN